jgi:hypothetical protein
MNFSQGGMRILYSDLERVPVSETLLLSPVPGDPASKASNFPSESILPNAAPF